MKSLVCDVESIALALSEHDGYEYYHIDDDLKELAKNVSDLQADNAKLRELVKRMHRHIRQTCGECDGWYCSNFDEDNECCVYDTLARELGVEVLDGD